MWHRIPKPGGCSVALLVGLAAGCSIPTEAGQGPPAPSEDSSTGPGNPSPATDSGGGETTGTASTTGNAADTSTGVGFAVDPDFGSDDAVDCDISQTSTCPAGEKCAPWSQSEPPHYTHCVPVARNPVGEGEACTLFESSQDMPVDDCDAEHYCVLTDAEAGAGICRRLCGAEGFTAPPPDPALCNADQACLSFGEILSVCFADCDPLLQDCQEAGTGCFVSDGLAGCVPTFSDDNLGEPGDPCFYINSCAPGSTCIEAQSLPECSEFACCSPYCDTSLPDTCMDALLGTVCTPLWEMNAPPGLENLGVCAEPTP